MTTDIDMLFAPNFLEWVVRSQLAFPRPLSLCRFVDLPPDVMDDTTDVRAEFERLRASGTYYDDSAIGPCLGAPLAWWHRIRGFDERLHGEDHDDYDLKLRAQRDGRVLVWLHEHTALLHQWHWRRYGEPTTPEEVAEHQRYRTHADANLALVHDQPDVVRNQDHEWGLLPPDGCVIEPPERRR